MNKAEDLVFTLCTKSFLSLWSYANPRGKDPRKELCDALVVCDPDVIIFSVKDIRLSGRDEDVTGGSRWHRKAVDESCKQIYGAERWITSATHVITAEGKQGLPFPPIHRRRIHRIAVAFGGHGNVSISFGDMGKGFVHVLDEVSLLAVMQELDTISDFTRYLKDKEMFFNSDVSTIMIGEENLLALYLMDGRSFSSQYDTMIINDGLYDVLRGRVQYQEKLKEDRQSYVWDRLIELLHDDLQHGRMLGSPSVQDLETILRVMAREDRFARRLLSEAFLGIVGSTQPAKLRARLTEGASGVTYVFLVCPHDMDRKTRAAELFGRCWVARSIRKSSTHVIGLATEQGRGHGSSIDAVSLHKEVWTEEDDARARSLQEELGYFANVPITVVSRTEYPPSPS